MRKLFIALALVAGIVGLACASSASAAPMQTLGGYPLHWSNGNSTTMHYVQYKDFTGWSETSAAFSYWDSNLAHVSVSTASTPSYCTSNVAAVAVICGELGGAGSACGTSYVHGTTSGQGGQAHITDTYSVFNTNTTCAPYHLQIACHEEGHILGLLHYATSTSCMNTYVSGQNYPNADDLATLDDVYNHGDVIGCCRAQLANNAKRFTIKTQFMPIEPFAAFQSTEVTIG